MTSFLRNAYNAILSYETRLWLYKARHPGEYRTLRTHVYPSAKGDFSLKAYDTHRCIFIHITKTAGTSVAKGLFGYLPYHYTAIDYRVIYGRKNFDTYYKFAFVRNPWDRLYSAYRYLQSGGWNDDDKKWRDANIAEFSDFNTFVMQWLSVENIKKHVHFLPQHHFICDKKDKLLLDYLAYFETINKDFDTIAKHLKLDVTLSHHNANPANSYLDVYTDEARNKVADIYRKDIDMFGYIFDGIQQRRLP